ncbi:hypothetical protein FQN54_002253 [Arachnomyces sp. PD_36]|nr:hypothetical protein FQN54_002253 [Arachnomyces sp. PD_36]
MSVMASSMPPNPQVNGVRSTWQEQLEGGRTAWSARVNIQGQLYSARYWYDGQYVNNAKEDAAEVALGKLSSQSRSPTNHAGQLYAQQGQNGQGGSGWGR